MATAPPGPPPPDGAVFECVFENERRLKTGEFSSDFLLSHEENQFSDHKGGPTPFNPEGDSDWMLEEHKGGEDGWAYALEFSEFSDWDKKKCVVCDDSHSVRRRKWFRRRRSSSRVSPPPRAEEMPGDIPLMRLGGLVDDSNCYAETPFDAFVVRGKEYISDKKKYPSEKSLFDLVCMELYCSDTKTDHISSLPGSFVQRQRRCEFAAAYLTAFFSEGDERFFFSVVFQAPYYHCNIVWALSDPAAAAKADPVAWGLWQKFLHGDQEFRDSRFKIIPQVVEGPWVVKKGVGKKPAILGRKIRIDYLHEENDHLELDVNIRSSFFASNLVKMLVGYCSAFSIDLGFVLEGKNSEELPERLLGTVRLNHLELKKKKEEKKQKKKPEC